MNRSHRPLVAIALLALSQGLGPGLTAFALPLILRGEGVSLPMAGLSTLLIWPTMLRFVIAPLVDRAQAGAQGKRRWLLWQVQALFTACFAMLALTPPEAGLALPIAIIAALNVIAAVQTVAAEGFAVRALPPARRGQASAVQLIAYYLGSILSGAGLIGLAQVAGWVIAVLALALIAALGAVVAYKWRDQQGVRTQAPGLRELRFDRPLLVLMGIALLLDLPQNAGIALLGPILAEHGYAIADAAALVGGVGLGAAIVGALGAGLWLYDPRRRGIRLLMLAAVQGLALLPLAFVLEQPRPSHGLIAAAVCLATASAGAFNTAFGAWLMDRVRLPTAATEMALLASLHSVSYVIAGPIAGYAAAALGSQQFLATAGLASLCLVPLLLIAPAPRQWPKRPV